MKRKQLSFTTRYVLAIGILLLVANVFLGVVTLQQSMASMRTLISKNMLDIVTSASGMIDGDVLGTLTEADVGGAVFQDIAKKLNVFKEHVDIRFIYAVRQVSPDEFVFTVDPDPVEPAAFGEDIVVTEALKAAGAGVPGVDPMPLADRWGNFYSAYSPVFDSAGRVAGVVGIDFDANWFDGQVRRHTLIIGLLSLLTVLIGGVVVFLITFRVRRKFKELDQGMSELSANVDTLMRDVVAKSGAELHSRIDEPETADELERLGAKIHAVQADVEVYLDYLHTQAYVDSLTHVGSSTAYHEKIRQLEALIERGEARFSVAVFDVNSLKNINDTYGHEWGDAVIIGAANAISAACGAERTYRIGGDEFAAIFEGGDASEHSRQMQAVQDGVAAYNAENTGNPATLAVSQGFADFHPGKDKHYREVFARADEVMYVDKRAYYEHAGDRRGKRHT